MPVSAIILAAGSSSRMGQSKQLLPWKDGTLLTHAIKTAMASRVGHVYVVLGSDEIGHRNVIGKLPVTIVSNPNWELGMGSSLKAGLKAGYHSDGVLVMVCDQPFVSPDHLNNIISHFEKTGQPVIASRYLDTAGVPALFGKKIFAELMTIGDHEGARKLIANKKGVELILLESGTDIDTQEDYRNALN